MRKSPTSLSFWIIPGKPCRPKKQQQHLQVSLSSCWTFNLTKKLSSLMYLNLLSWNCNYTDTQLWYLIVKKEMHRSLTHCFSFLHHSNSRQQRSALWGSYGELADIVQDWCLFIKTIDNYHMRPGWSHPNTLL